MRATIDLADGTVSKIQIMQGLQRGFLNSSFSFRIVTDDDLTIYADERMQGLKQFARHLLDRELEEVDDLKKRIEELENTIEDMLQVEGAV